MGARNCEELGINLQKICQRLLSNDDLVNLMYYESTDPLSERKLSTDAKQKLLNDLVIVIPKAPTRNDAKSFIVIGIPAARGLSDNSQYKKVDIIIQIYVPAQQWVIRDSNLRPFAIMGQIQKSLDNKTINGLGKISGGDFELVQLGPEMTIYQQSFSITEYD